MKKPRMTKSELAEMLTLLGWTSGGGGPVTVKQVDMWFVRRANNGFPDKEGTEERRKGVQAPVFDPVKVLAWRRAYVPSKGGRPPSKHAKAA